MDTWNELHNKYTGTAIIIANGPGLKDIPISFLQKYPSFGTNRIYLLQGFTSTFYAVCNPLVISQSLPSINSYPTSIRFSNHTAIQGLHFKNCYSPRFSTDPRKGLNEGWTITHICLQLAYWLGFTEILLVGLDHFYNDAGIVPNKKETRTTADTDHFTPDYFPPGTIWNRPDLVQSERSYLAALKAYTKDRRSIINISTASACTIFPCEDWKQYA